MKKEEFLSHIKSKLDASEREATSSDAKWLSAAEMQKLAQDKLVEIKKNKNVIQHTLQA